ncbi:hypothetical protein I4U23_015839 [Adineta vaga]|nr:hypothetical protein I4U23_015839 [Adineta vaga]
MQNDPEAYTLSAPLHGSRNTRFVAIMIILLLIFIIILLIIHVIEINKRKENINDLCLTPYCIKAANYLLESIDEKIDPCENFYEFTCGKWIKDAIISSESGEQRSISQIVKKLQHSLVDLLSSNATEESRAITNARRLYSSSLIDKELGGWPVLKGSTWNESTFDFDRLMLKLSEHNNYIFYTVKTEVDENNSSIRSIQIGPSNIVSENFIHYSKEIKVLKAYGQFFEDLTRALTDDWSTIENDLDALMEFEMDLFQNYTMQDLSFFSETIRTTVGNLSHTVNVSFDSSNYVRRLYLFANVSLVDTDIVIVHAPKLMHAISSILDQQSPRTIQNYMIWRFMMNRSVHMPKRFRHIAQQFAHTFHGTSTEESREVACARYVNVAMSLVVAKLYIKEYFHKDARIEATEMINNIRNTFITMINHSTWMDSESKIIAINKARAIRAKIGYPDYLENDNMTKLDTDYAEYNFNSSYMLNVLSVIRLYSKATLQMLRHPFDSDEWADISPTRVNAIYKLTTNEISIKELPRINI